jgi:hypothetical protein
MRRTSLSQLMTAVGTFVVGGVLWALADYPLLKHLGATIEEATRPLPGDELVPGAVQSTRAITVEARPDAIWPWLVQMGQDRAGFYTYDWLERLFGAEIHNAAEIRPEWQKLAVGDAIWPYPERKLRAMARGSLEVGSWTVAVLQPSQTLVVQSRAGRWTWALVLESLSGGRTRLLARTRFAAPQSLLARALDAVVMQPAHLIMETGVLRGIKARAERAPVRRPVHQPAEGIRP